LLEGRPQNFPEMPSIRQALRRALQLRPPIRSEFYNPFNKKNFLQPEISLASSKFGGVTKTFDPGYMQLALKLQF